METVQVQRMFSIVSLFFCGVFACDQISTVPTCSISMPFNKPLINRLSGLFDKDSQTTIVEYNVRIRNDNGSYGLYKGSNPDSFEPWKWYRTQGMGSSHLLLTSDFYFGFLKKMLWLGIEEVNLDLDVSPPGCLQGAEDETLDIPIINFLLKDLDIGNYSPHWATVHSDIVEICTTLIAGSNGKGNLKYKCYSYGSEKQIICDDDSPDDCACALNVVILILSCVLVVLFYIKFGIHNSIGGKQIKGDSNNYILEHTYSFLLYHQGTSNDADTPCIPSHVLDSMTNFKAKIDPPNGNFIVTVRKTSLHMPRNQLLSEADQVHLLQNFFDYLFLLRDKKPKWKRFGTIFFIMLMLFLPSLPFYIFMWWCHGWYQELVVAFGKRGLQGPFYFQWSSNLEDQTCQAMLLKLVHGEPRLNTENTVSALTNETLDHALGRLGIDHNNEQWTDSKIEFDTMSTHLQLKYNRPFLFLSEYNVPLITRDFLKSCLKWNCPQNCKCNCQHKCKWYFYKALQFLQVGLVLVLIGTFIALVIIMVKAYSDIYYISPSNRVFYSFITSLVPLVVQHFNKINSPPRSSDGNSDRRFHKELWGAIKNYHEHLVVNDFTDFDVAEIAAPVKEGETNNSQKLKYDIQDPGQKCPLLSQQCCPC